MNSGKVYLMKHASQKQEDPLNLQSLPMVSPTGDYWPGVEAALKQRRKQQRTRRYAIGALAAAATVTLMLALLLQQPPSGPEELRADRTLVQTQGPTTGGAEDSPVLSEQPAPDPLDALITLSQRLEGRLRAIRSGVGNLPTDALVYQVELEDLVAQVDEELSAQPDSLPLWNQRVSLLMDIERLYENSVRREYQLMASL